MAEVRRPKRGHVRIYDFRRPDRFSKEQLRALYMVHEHVARLMAPTLAAFYRGPVQLAVPPLEGRALLDVDPELAFPLIDRMFGGPGETLPERRPLTDIEQTVIRRVCEALARAVGEGWAQLAAVQPAVEGLETNPAFLQLAAPNEVVLTVELSLQMGDHSGLLRLCLPYMLLEPVLPRLSTEPWLGTRRRPGPMPQVQQLLGRVEVTVTACLGRARLSLGELLELEPGDVIPLQARRDRPIEVRVEDQLKFWAEPGKVNGRLAVRVVALAVEEEGGEPHGS